MLWMLDPEGAASDIQGTGEVAGFTKDGSFAMLIFSSTEE